MKLYENGKTRIWRLNRFSERRVTIKREMTGFITKMIKFSFSGHEKFHCRQFWLKKGYDFLTAGKNFSDDDAVVALGVGRNMANSIRYWMKVFDLVN
ncbi:MAG: DUF4007 family protein [Desulfococcaceae bacterium]